MKCSIGNIVNNIAITIYSASWVQEISEGTLSNVHLFYYWVLNTLTFLLDMLNLILLKNRNFYRDFSVTIFFYYFIFRNMRRKRKYKDRVARSFTCSSM